MLYYFFSVMNNFPSEEREFQLCTSMFQNMFPTINVTKERFKHFNLINLVSFMYNQDFKITSSILKYVFFNFAFYNILALK